MDGMKRFVEDKPEHTGGKRRRERPPLCLDRMSIPNGMCGENLKDYRKKKK